MTQWGSCYSIFSVLCSVVQIIVCLVVPFFWPLYCRSFLNLWLSGVRVARSVVFCVVFCRSLFVLLSLSFDHCIVVPSSIYGFSGVRVARSLVCCVVFCRTLFVLLSLSFGHCIVVPSSIYGLVGFVLLDLQFSVQCFVDHCLSCCPFLLTIVLSFLLQSMAQWDSCCSIFSFLCSVLQIIVCLVVPFF